MSLVENLHFRKSASIAFDRSNANMDYAQTLNTSKKREQIGLNPEMSSLFSVSDVFANAKVMLCYA